jgi:hypothetical protein
MDLGVLGALPFGRGLPPIRRIEAQQVDRVAHPDARRIIGGRRKLGIEIHVGAGDAIKKLEIAEERHRRPDILDKQHLAPAAVTDHHIRGEALALQPLAKPGHRKAVHHRHFHLLQVRRDRARRRQRQVFEKADARDLTAAALRDKDHVVAGFPEVPHQVNVLTRKKLMDEEEIHRSRKNRDDAVRVNPG